MQAVFGLVVHDGVLAIDHGVRHFLAAGGGQRMHVVGNGLGKLEVLVRNAPVLLELLAVLFVLFLAPAVGAPQLLA